MKVFVYGALMADARILRTAQPASLRDHATRFTAKGFTFLEPRFLALEPAPGELAHGALAEVDLETWTELIAHEDGYQEHLVHVLAMSGLEPAKTLVLHEEERVEEGVPSGRYADCLVEGAVAVGLPDVVVERYREAASKGTPITRYLRPIVGGVKRLL